MLFQISMLVVDTSARSVFQRPISASMPSVCRDRRIGCRLGLLSMPMPGVIKGAGET